MSLILYMSYKTFNTDNKNDMSLKMNVSYKTTWREWLLFVLQIKYYHDIGQVISCSNNPNTALVIGELQKLFHSDNFLPDLWEKKGNRCTRVVCQWNLFLCTCMLTQINQWFQFSVHFLQLLECWNLSLRLRFMFTPFKRNNTQSSVVMMGFSLRARIVGEGLSVHSPPAFFLFLFFLFEVEISWRTPVSF